MVTVGMTCRLPVAVGGTSLWIFKRAAVVDPFFWDLSAQLRLSRLPFASSRSGVEVEQSSLVGLVQSGG
jgi:hypothetical protein